MIMNWVNMKLLLSNQGAVTEFWEQRWMAEVALLR